MATRIADEVTQLRDHLPQLHILSSTEDFVTALYRRSCNPTHTEVRVTATFPEGYPKRALILAVDASAPACVSGGSSSNRNSGVVPPGLKRKIEKEMSEIASTVAASNNSSSSSQQSQLCAVYEHLISFIDTNRFVPCWKELKQAVTLVQSSGGNITLNEQSGKMLLQLCSGKYLYKCTIVVDDGYPSTVAPVNYGKACQLKLLNTNLPKRIETAITSQAGELVKRLQDGMDPQKALQMSNPVKLSHGHHAELESGNAEPNIRLTKDVLKGLHHDVETLSLVRDLRQVDAATKQGDANVKTHTKHERKDARRDVRKLTAAERAQDQAIDDKEKDWQQQEAKRMAGYNLPEYDGSNPQPSLLVLIQFLVDEMKRLTRIKCPVCHEPALPADPSKLNALFQTDSTGAVKTEKERKAHKSAKRKRPERVYCGCWYHHSCLERTMTEPDFGKTCKTEGCEREIWHTNYPDRKTLEREWAGRQARQREIDDAAMFL